MKVLVVVLFFIFITSGCSKTADPIAFGEDGCAYCKMTIADKKYGAEIVTNTGKVHKFDAIECMINFEKKDHIKQGEIDKRLVITIDNPGTLVATDSARYLRARELPSPMGMYINGVSQDSISELATRYTGKVYTWDKLVSQFDKLPSLAQN